MILCIRYSGIPKDVGGGLGVEPTELVYTYKLINAYCRM